MRKINNLMGVDSKTVLVHVVEFSLFGGIVTALAAGVISLR